MYREEKLVPFDYKSLIKKNSKTLHRSLCIPSVANAYAECIEFAKHWFLSKFQTNPFKSIYIDGKYIYNESRSLNPNQTIKREKPALAIIPSIDWNFNDDNIDMYQFGTNLYQEHRLFVDAFLKDRSHQVYVGLGVETLLVNFTYKMRVETRAQQMDLFKYIQLACRVGSTSGEEVDLDFHIPYELMVQIAMDTGFEVDCSNNKSYPRIKNVKAFLSYLNTHSVFPFVYKFRGMNGKNEFFIRMQRVYVHVRASDLSADDGEMEGHLKNNFGIEMSVEIRFPAPKLYGYYSNNEPELKNIYSAFRQPQGIVSTFYTFKGTPIPDQNKFGWNLYLETTWEEDDIDKIGKKLQIDFSELLNQGDIGEAIHDCINQGISPSIFCDFIIVNGGDKMDGNIDWNTMQFTSTNPAKGLGSYIGIYVDMEYVNNYIACERTEVQNRIQHTKDPKSTYDGFPPQ